MKDDARAPEGNRFAARGWTPVSTDGEPALDRVVRDVPRIRPPAPRSGTLASWGLSFVLCILFAVPAMADDHYSSARKLGRGAANVSLGILALPGEIVDTTREKGPFVGATWGLVKGVGMTVVTELVGVWEIVTCPFQFPPDWKPIISPEFPWQRFDPNRPKDEPRQRPIPRIR